MKITGTTTLDELAALAVDAPFEELLSDYRREYSERLVRVGPERGR